VRGLTISGPWRASGATLASSSTTIETKTQAQRLREEQTSHYLFFAAVAAVIAALGAMGLALLH
jgi:hypothetical protein